MIEYFIANLWQAWAIVAVICLILELTSGDFFFCSFAIGATIAAVASVLFPTFWVQLGVFAVVSVVSIWWLRPLVLRYMHKGEKQRASNYDAMVGRRGRVSQTVPVDGFGRVAIDGDDWKAQSADHEVLPVGTPVRVVAIESIIISVTKEQ